MRGKNPATVKDVKEQTRVMKAMLTKLEETVKKTRNKLTSDIHILQKDMHHVMDDDSYDDGPTVVQDYCPSDDEDDGDDFPPGGSDSGEAFESQGAPPMGEQRRVGVITLITDKTDGSLP